MFYGSTYIWHLLYPDFTEKVKWSLSKTGRRTNGELLFNSYRVSFFQDGGVIGTKHIDVLNARGLCAAMCFVAVSGHLGTYVLQ